jgi:hypothetical protein
MPLGIKTKKAPTEDWTFYARKLGRSSSVKE